MKSYKPLIYRGVEVDALTGTSKSARHERENPQSPQYDPTWPLPIKLSTRAVGYYVSEIEDWLASRPRVRSIPVAKEGV